MVHGTDRGRSGRACRISWCRVRGPQESEKGVAGPVVTLNRSLIVPFLQFSPNRVLRQRAYEAWVARGANGNDHDNRAVAAEILALRQERAKLLGYKSFADYKLEPEMAKTPAAVRDLVAACLGPCESAGRSGCRGILEAMMHADGVNGTLEPWDWRYYSEKRRKAEHDLDEAALKPYLSLDAMLGCAVRLCEPLVRVGVSRH